MKTDQSTVKIVNVETSPIVVFSAIKQVIPDAVQNRIIQLRDENDRLQWRLGDLFNEIYSYVRANKVEATRADVANYLLQSLGMEDERSYSSILIDAATAAFYPAKPRSDFNVLPFSHFRFAAGFGPEANKVLETAMLFFNQYGRPPSIKWLKKEFSLDLFELAAKASDPKQAITPEAQAGKIGSFGQGPDYEQEPIGGPVERVRYHVYALRNTVPALPIKNAQLVAQIVALCNDALDLL